MSHTVLSLAGPVMALKAASRPEDDDEADLLLPWSFPPITFLVTLRPTAERRREQVDKEIIQKYSASSSCVQTAKCSHTNIIALVTSKPVTNICNDTDSSTYVTVCPAYFAVSVTVTARAMFKFLGASSFAFFLLLPLLLLLLLPAVPLTAAFAIKSLASVELPKTPVRTCRNKSRPEKLQREKGRSIIWLLANNVKTTEV